MLEVDVVPGQGLKLAGPRVRVDRDRVHDSEPAVDPPAPDELRELARVKVDLGLRVAVLRSRHACRRVVDANAEVALLRRHRVLEHLADQDPCVARGLPLDPIVGVLRECDAAVHLLDDALDVLARDGADRERAQGREHVVLDAPTVVRRGR
ncbi:MAG: hypothetical protein ACRENE_23490 [Polyangiaceae bacterium]